MIRVGERYGRLVVLADAGPSPRGRRLYACACDCGARKVVHGHSLKSGNTTSCGCRHREEVGALRRTHGLSRTPEYKAAVSAHMRCTDARRTYYRHYGGRGIEYRLPLDFGEAARRLLATIGPRPKGLTLDRIDNEGHYEIGNLRWATWSEQNSNQRRHRRVARGIPDTKLDSLPPLC